MAQRGVREQAVKHNDQTATHSEPIVCQGLSAAVVWVQRDVIVKEFQFGLLSVQSDTGLLHIQIGKN